MKIVVTGGAGFIGSSFVNLCIERGHSVVVVDKITYAGSLKNICLDTDNIELLLEDINKVTNEDLGEFDYLVNFAAESHVDNSIKNGLPFVESNVNGTFNLLEIARKNPNLKKFVQISTDEVYGDLHTNKIKSAKETTNLNPSSYYSSTKASADLLVESAHITYGLPYLITRTVNNFGVRQHKEKFIPTIIEKVKNDQPIPIYGDGQHIREWIWVEDNVSFIYDLMLSEATGIRNIGSEFRISNMGIISLLSEITNKNINVEFVEDRKGHDRRYGLNTLYDQTPKITKSLKQFLQEQV